MRTILACLLRSSLLGNDSSLHPNWCNPLHEVLLCMMLWRMSQCQERNMGRCPEAEGRTGVLEVAA